MSRGVHSHKINCQCYVCRAIRGETKGKNNSFYNYHHTKETKQKNREAHLGKKHKSDCQCCFCRAKRKELKGENHPSFGKELKHVLNCQCPFCKARRGENSGPNHFNWHGGISFLPYPFSFNEELREHIRNRDKVCQLCGKTKKQNRRKLIVHHIDYNKDNLDEDNLIALCLSCHVKTNYNRDFWKELLIMKMDESGAG